MKNQVTNWQKIDKRLLVLILLICAVFVRLGFWQLDRAQQKIVMQTELEQQMQATPKNICEYVKSVKTDEYLTLSDDAIKTIMFKPVTINALLTEQYFLIDNQTHNGRVGYEVVQIAQACETDFALSRGFVIANPDRSILPEVDLHAGKKTKIEAYLYVPSNNQFIQQDRITEVKKWPIRLTQIDLSVMNKLTKNAFTLFPAVLRLKTGEQLLTPHWSIIKMKPAKHYAYAIQWFAFAICLFGLFIYASLKDG